jgi:hypothetical protein
MKKSYFLISLLFIGIIHLYAQNSIPAKAEKAKITTAITTINDVNALFLLKNPYSMSPTTTSVRILWQTSSSTQTGVVQYGTTVALGQVVTSSAGWNVVGEGYMHVVTLTNLQPFTTYYYKVGDGVNFNDKIGTTKTAPEKGTNFRLASLSDIHGNSGNVWKDMTNRVVNTNPDMTVFIGDFVNDGSMRTGWNSGFFTPGEPLLNKVVITGAIGNHETYNGPTTYYDYFSFPAHSGTSEGTLDPRGEAYFSTNYGDAKIISFNNNGDAYSPSFLGGSLQLAWLENEIATADSKWIFVFSHVNTISTGTHAQWSDYQKKFLMPMYEKYAAQGKHLIVFGGDEHNFEHLYKAGVHYVRPGAANTDIRGQFNLADLPYSMLFKQVAGFSTIDVKDNGELVELTGRDSTGTEFYTYRFTQSAQPLPSLYISEPDGIDDKSTNVYRIKWSSFDASGTAKINLYYSVDGINGTLIAENLSSGDASASYYDWNVHSLTPGDYFVYGTISDGINPPFTKFAKGKVSVFLDSTPPPAPANLTGVYTENKINLTWKNPTELIPVDNNIASFDNGLDGFTGLDHNTSTGSLLLESGYLNNGLKISYDIKIAWDQYSAICTLPALQNYSSTPTLSFWYKGDGSVTKLRLIVKQDNDKNGVADDWWYDESLNLSANEWKLAEIDLNTFKAFTWHTNSETTFSLNKVFSIEFVVPSVVPAKGYVRIDEVKVSGKISPALDFQGVALVRRTDRFPVNKDDGLVVYTGNAETATDQVGVVTDTKYFYSIFAYDNSQNYSPYNVKATWGYPTSTDIFNGLKAENYKLNQNFPNPFSSSTSIQFSIPESERVTVSVYNAIGQKVAMLINEQMSAGQHITTFDGTRFSNGLYNLRLETDHVILTKKMILNR